MRNPISRPLFVPLFAVAACASSADPVDPGADGSDKTALPGDHDQAGSLDDSTPVPKDCDYTEAHDTTNDYLEVEGAVEDTGITFDKTVQRTVCGKINHGHFDTDWYSIDVDNYAIDIPQSGDVELTFTTGPQLISDLGVYAVNTDDNGNLEAATYFIYDHGVFSAFLPAGHYQFSVEAYDNQDIDADVDYKMHLNVDHPVQRCARVTAPATYTESLDGANSTGNDTILVDYSAKSMSIGSPEVAGMSMAVSNKYRISGVSDQLAQDGSYYDRDTFQIATGSTTNQISVRLNWSGQTSDLDYYLFPAGQTFNIGSAAHAHLGEDEFGTFPVSPNQSYWLWVGASATDASSAWVPYDVSICAEQFTE